MFNPLRLLTPALVTLVILAPPTAAHADEVLPTRPASSSGTQLGPERVIAAARFPAGQRFVTATITARPGPRPILLSAELDCGGQVAQATTNITRSATLQPRRVMRDARHCVVRARAARSNPTTRDQIRVTARITSYPIHWGVTGQNPTAWPTLLRAGQRYDAAAVAGTAPAGATAVRIGGDLKVTSCTMVGGSRENGSPNLCKANRINPGGTWLRVSLIGQQRNTDGYYCQVRAVATRLLHIDRIAHHKMVSLTGTLPLSRDENCARIVRVKLYLEVVSGADAVVHRLGTLSHAWAR